MKRNNHGRCPGCLRAPLTRRDVLKIASNGFGMLALSALMSDKAYAGLAHHKGPHFTPKAKNVVFLFMPGAVSHVDTFDPKPKLEELDGKPFDGFYRAHVKKCVKDIRRLSPPTPR